LKPTPLTKQALNEVILRMPFNRLLDFRVSRVYKDGLTLELEFGETMTNVLGTLHGGVTATLVDASIGMAVIGSQGGRPATTVELSVNYLRPHSSGKVRARARLLKVGRTLAFGVAEVKDEHGHLIASGSATYMLL
jgi:acyl-CoA thioesterase